MLPSQYTPNQPSDFVGQTRQVAEHLQRQVKTCQDNGNAPIKIMLLGRPGIGKSAIAKWLIHTVLQATQWSIDKFNGTDVNIEVAKTLANSYRQTSLIPGYRVTQIEEVDKMSTAAQVRFLTFLDDLPASSAVICTSNCSSDQLVDRFQSRFIIHDIPAPTPEDIRELITKHWTIPAQALNHITEFASGNVRQALLDTETALLAAA